MILTDEEKQQFDRVLELVTYGNDNKPHFPEEAVQLMNGLADNFKTLGIQPENAEPEWIKKLNAADTYTYMIVAMCETPYGIAFELAVTYWVILVAEKLRKERQ